MVKGLPFPCAGACWLPSAAWSAARVSPSAALHSPGCPAADTGQDTQLASCSEKNKQEKKKKGCCVFVGCLTSQQHASVSQGRICSDNFTCCHTEIEVADQNFYLIQSQYTDTRLTSPSTDPITPGAWQGSHWSANFYVTSMTRPGSSAPEADALTSRAVLSTVRLLMMMLPTSTMKIIIILKRRRANHDLVHIHCKLFHEIHIYKK